MCSSDLVQVVDAARLLEHASPEEALLRAQKWGIGAAVQTALAHCRAVLDDTALPWLASPDDVMFAHQPSLSRKLMFDVMTAGSARQLAARMMGAGAQWIKFRRATAR